MASNSWWMEPCEETDCFMKGLVRRNPGEPEFHQAVREFVAGKVEFRNDDGGNVHIRVGKKSFKKEQLVGNVEAFLDHLRGIKPPSAKGVYIQKANLAATMSPGVPLVISS